MSFASDSSSLPPFVELDVRPVLAAGGSPLAPIMDAVDGLAPGQGLRLIVPFDPVPLYGRLAARGLVAEKRMRGDHWDILFRPGTPGGQ